MLLKILLWINISLFILHEMNAVKTREWKMMFLMNRLNDNKGHIVFTSLHFCLFIIIFYFADRYPVYTSNAIAVLLIVHQFMHIAFIKHAENRMNNTYSRIIIFAMFANSCVGLLVYYFFN